MAVILQNSTTKDRIYIGDTYPVVIEHRIADPTANPGTQNRGIPADVNSAFAKVWSLQANDYLDIGGPGIDQINANIVAATSTVGALISYTVPSEFTLVTGDYSVFITFEYGTNQVSTIRRRYKVLNKR